MQSSLLCLSSWSKPRSHFCCSVAYSTCYQVIFKEL
ncbi:hypothetical protein SLEP1_g27044 [Rubroshorea leprosula]|uniref:Uncharacterized protein n=1 Tax=Rubroshorea leprosula TaxID=152421 RepID=A0AAV5JVK9_9ROSI|nr:hypothetical protein SLEP1_g27044 [Rubroshorea leprosula]